MLSTEVNSTEGNNKETAEGLELEIAEQAQWEHIGVEEEMELGDYRQEVRHKVTFKKS